MQPIQSAYADFLAPLPARWLWTLTLRPKATRAPTARVPGFGRGGGQGHPESLSKAFRLAVLGINRDLYGQDFNPRQHLGVGWLLGHERHRSGEPHGHAILYALEDLDALVSRRAHWAWWFRERGINRLEPVRAPWEATEYSSKYVLKDGNIELSDNLGAYVKLCREVA